MMWPGNRNDFGSVLSLIRFPQEGVTLLNAPQSGRLAARDIEVQMRPATAPSFLPRPADLLSYADLCAGPHCRVNGLQMAVAIIPATVVEQIDYIVARFRRAV